MTDATERPLAFIDIDGVLNRCCSNSQAKRRGLARFHGWSAGQRWPLWLDADDRGRIERLSEVFDPAWGTTWEHDAWTEVGSRLGLRQFDVVAITNPGEHSKAPGVVHAAGGRPFVWFDDDALACEIDADQPHLVIEVDPVQGLTDEHIDMALFWAMPRRFVTGVTL